MRLPRFAQLVTAVALVLVPSVVVTAQPAAAEDRPVDPRIATLDDAKTYLPQDAYNQLVGDLNKGVLYEDTVQPPEWFGAVAAKIGGTPAQVQAGTKGASRACKTGWGCLTYMGIALGGLALDQWAPWEQSEAGSPLADVDPVYYLSQRSPTYAVNVTGSGFTGTSAPFTVGGKGQGVSGAASCNSGCAMSFAVGFDYVVNGVWAHYSTARAFTVVNNQVFSQQTTPVPAGLVGNPDVEVRRIHWSELSSGQAKTYGGDRGFYWGQNIIDVTATVEALTRCARPDGSTYDKITTEPITSGLAAAPACDPGDTPVYVQLTTVLPDGTREVQSSQRLDTKTDADATFPDCATGCQWVVKVNGVSCVDGLPQCVNWTTDKSAATCWYGPYQMPLGSCYFLERAYEHGTTIPTTKPNTDGDPITWDGPTPQLTPTSNPTPSSTTSTTTSPSPSASPSNGPGPTPSGDPSSSPSPSSSSSPSPSPSPSVPTPKPSSTPSTDVVAPPRPECVSTYSLGPVQTEAVALANNVGGMFSVSTIYGYREPTSDWAGEHSSGLALDFMTGSDSAKGQAIADHLVANAGALGVRWVIWEQQVWNVERAAEGWRGMEDRGSPTENHMDHVHVYLYDTDSALPCSGDPTDSDGAGGGCMANGPSFPSMQWVFHPVKCVLEWAFIPPGGSQMFADHADSLATQFRASSPGQWWGLASDVGEAVEGLEGGGASFAQLRAETEAVEASGDVETYDGAQVMVASPMRIDPGGGEGPPGGDWNSDGGPACQGPAVGLGFIDDWAEDLGVGTVPDQFYPFSACEEPVATVAQTSQWVLTSLIGFSIFWTIIRQFGAAFGVAIVDSGVSAGSDYGGEGHGYDKRHKS